MVNPFWKQMTGLAVVGLLASCQPTSAPTAPASEPAVATRVIEHARGTSPVPHSPQRVVVLDYAPLDSALALGIQPVGRMEVIASPVYPQSINAIPLVGSGSQPNLETILQLNPDLILSNDVSTGRLYEQLSQIAPTILSQDNGRTGEWQANFRLYAEALGQTDRAEQLLAEYQRRVESLQASLTPAPGTVKVSVIAHWSGGVVAYSVDSFSGSVLQDLGFARNPSQGEGKRYGIKLSREDLTQIDGDIVFLLYNPTMEASVARAEFVSDPLWSRLQAVKQGIVCEVDSATWTGGRSILAANQILTDVETCLTQEN